MERRARARKKKPARRSLPNIDRAQFSPPMTVSFPKNCVGFPDRLITILKYSQQTSASGSATPSAQAWIVNSCYDPDATGTGHQPSFFDTLSSVYARYYVRAFKLEVDFSNHTTTAGAFVVCGYSDQNITPNTVEQLVEARYSQMKTLGFNVGPAVKRISLPWMTTQQLMGQPFAEADDNMYAGTGASPTDTAWGYTKCAADDGSTNVAIDMRTILYQEVVFKDLLPQISS